MLCLVISFKVERRLVIERRVQTFSIVKHFDVSKQQLLGLLACLGNAAAEVVKAFGLERRSKAFHQRVVVTVATAAHALDDVTV